METRRLYGYDPIDIVKYRHKCPDRDNLERDGMIADCRGGFGGVVF